MAQGLLLTLKDQRDQKQHSYFALTITTMKALNFPFLSVSLFLFHVHSFSLLLNQVAEEDLYSFAGFPTPDPMPHRTLAGSRAKMIGNTLTEKEN